MMRPQVAPARVIPVAPQERPPYCGIHTEGHPTCLLQPIETRPSTALSCGQIPICPQVRKEGPQTTLVASASSGRIVVMMALVLLPVAIMRRLQGLEGSGIFAITASLFRTQATTGSSSGRKDVRDVRSELTSPSPLCPPVSEASKPASLAFWIK